MFRNRSADTATPHVQPFFSFSFDLEDFKVHSRVVESEEEEKGEKKGEEAWTRKALWNA